jgi:hypothetical protein
MRQPDRVSCIAVIALLCAVCAPAQTFAEGGSIGGSIGKHEKSVSGGHEAESSRSAAPETPHRSRSLSHQRRRNTGGDGTKSAERGSPHPGQRGQVFYPELGGMRFRRDPLTGIQIPELPHEPMRPPLQ